MSRALVTFATGRFEELLELSLPGFQRYADRHGYELDTRAPRMLMRPASWGKVIRLLHALDEHDEALWIDCDCLILDDEHDLADEVPADAWHAITRHRTPEGEIPSCGVWLVRRAAIPELEQIWKLKRFLHHPWWEQAALHERLGYGGRPIALQKASELYWRTYWLETTWNALRLEHPFGPEDDEARIVHVGPGSSVDVRAQLMRRELEHQPTTEGVSRA